jgi:tetratricopeptide (TPR) repeat protein
MSNSTYTLVNDAIDLQDSGKLPEAQEMYLKILAIEPNNFAALHQMGLLANDVGNYDVAFAYASEAMKCNPNSALPINTLGLVFLNKMDFDKASICFKKCISIDPNLIHAYQNLGATLERQKKFAEALPYYQKALSANPKNGWVMNNMANIYQVLGEFEKAKELYIKALPLTNYNIDVIYGTAQTFCLLNQYNELHEFVKNIGDKQYLSEFQLAGLRITEAIIYLLENNYEMVECAIKKLDGLSSNEAPFPNYDGLIIYLKYLDKLVNFRKENPDLYLAMGKKLFIIGESHCLSPANILVELNGFERNCASKFILGGQARHFAKPESNQYKSTLGFILNDIPENSTIMPIFGEIDCRINFGILPYHKKIGKTDKESLNCTINEIVSGYVDYFIQIAKVKKCDIIFCGIPAAHSDKWDFSDEDKDILNYIIETFNETLGDAVKRKNIAFIDVFNHTKASAGEASGKYHIDNNHLFPNVLAELLIRN